MGLSFNGILNLTIVFIICMHFLKFKWKMQVAAIVTLSEDQQ